MSIVWVLGPPVTWHIELMMCDARWTRNNRKWLVRVVGMLDIY